MNNNRNYLFAAGLNAAGTICVGVLTAWVALSISKVGNETRETRAATVEIKHSVNSERDRIVNELKVSGERVTALEQAIKLLLIERAAKTPEGQATPTELQSDKPLPIE